MTDETAPVILALATENAELRAQLAETQDLFVEVAVDAGVMHAEVEALRTQIANLVIGKVKSTTQA